MKSGRKFLKYVTSALAALVIFATTYSLILPAITLDESAAENAAGIELQLASADVVEADATMEAAEEFSDDNFVIEPVSEPEEQVPAEALEVLSDESENKDDPDAAPDASADAEDPEIAEDADAQETGEDGASAEPEAADSMEDADGQAQVSDEEETSADAAEEETTASDLSGMEEETDAQSEEETEAEPLEEETTEESAEAMPAMTFEAVLTKQEAKETAEGLTDASAAESEEQTDPKEEGSFYLKVTAQAEEGTFPAGTVMEIREAASDKAVLDAVESAIDKEVKQIQAVDITFYNKDGIVIEPEKEIKVTIASGVFEDEKKEAASDPVLLHIPEDGDAQIMETSNEETEDDQIKFESDAFSVYAVVYTVDFHWEVNGKTYTCTLPGGGFASFAKLMEVLHEADKDASKDSGDDPEEQKNETASDDAQTSQVLSLNDVTVSEETMQFVENVEQVEFSQPALLSVSKTEQDTTVGDIKKRLGLVCEYSAALTEEEIAQMDAAEVKKGDWALISLKAFDTEENLTVTMNTGEVFTIRVTDAQATDPLGLDKQSFVISSDGTAMKAETDSVGQLNSHALDNELGDLYTWTFEYDRGAFDSTGGYYLSCDGKYIKVDDARYISLVDSAEEATPFKVTFDNEQLSTDTHEKGKYLFSTSADSSTGFLDYRYFHYGIATTSGASSWMSLRSPQTPSADAGYVGTWDILSDGIVLKMFDYSGTLNGNDIDTQWGNNLSENPLRQGTGINAGRGLLFTGSGMNGLTTSTVSKINQFTGEWNQTSNVKKYNKMANQGIVEKTLNADGYPVLASQYWQTNDTIDQGSLGYLFGAGGQDGVTAYEGAGGNGLQGFFRKDENNYYYYDSEWNYARMNETNDEILLYSDSYKKDTPTDGIERKEKIGFFPFTDYNTSKREEKGPQQTYYNHQFGTSMHTDFFYPTNGIDPETGLPMKFEFSGDDDVWVFVDGVLLLDMGGVHQPVRGEIDFNTCTVTIWEYDYNGNEIITTKTFDELFAGTGKTFSKRNMSKHSLDFFYLERGGCDSNCAIRFNLLVTKTLYLQKEIEGLEYLTEEERAKYENMVFTMELNMRDTSEDAAGQPSRFELYNTTNPDAVDLAENYTVRRNAEGEIIEQGFPIKDGQISIRNGETVAISKLPPTIQYYVSEEDTEVMDVFEDPRAVDRKEKNQKLTYKKTVLYGNDLKAWTTPNQNLKSNDLIKYYNRIPLTDLAVVKDWKDAETKDHSADTVQFTISATVPGEGSSAVPVPYPVDAIDGKTFTLTAGENWTKTFSNLPSITPEGIEITYTVHEIPVAGYAPTVKVTTLPDAANGNQNLEFKIENAPFKIKVKKNWIGLWPDDDKVDDIAVTLKRYKLVDKENLIIHSDVTKPDAFQYHAQYSVYDENDELVVKANSFGEDVVLSLPDGTYTIVQTTEDPESGYDISHDPQSRQLGPVEVHEDATEEVTFHSIYEQHTGSLTVKSAVTAPTGTFDAVYVIYDENDREVGRASYSEANGNGKEFTLPVGSYRVAETIQSTPANCTLKSSSVTPESGLVTLARGESKTVQYDKTYEEIVDSNNRFEIYHWNYNDTLLEDGSIPDTYPAGTKVRLTFYCSNGDWFDRDVEEAQYNGHTMPLQHASENYNGEFCAKFWVEYTLVQDQTLKIKINANPNDHNHFINKSVRIDPVDRSFQASVRQTKSRALPAPSKAAEQYADRTLENTGLKPETVQGTKKYVEDSWSREVILKKAANWELTVADGLEALDENGNPYYYFIESATEPGLRVDALAVIDNDGEEKLLVSKDNMETPLTLSNTLEIVKKDILIKKAGYQADITQTEPLAGAVFQLLEDSQGYPDGDGSFTITEDEKITGHLICGLEKGKIYTLRELVPPEGYNKVAGDMQFRITQDGIELLATSDNVILSDNKLEITVLNQAGAALPHTGGPGSGIFLAVGSTLVLGAAGLLLKKRKKTI